jgi:hypothetical protein
MKVEEFHTFDNWKDHPSYKFYQDMKALLTGENPDDVTDTELCILLKQSRGIFLTLRRDLENGANYYFSDKTLYRWLYVNEENQQFEEVKDSFVDLVMNYRKVNKLTLQDPDIDTLLGELRLAVQYEPDFVSSQGPSNPLLNKFFGLTPKQKIFDGPLGHAAMFKLFYGLFRRSSAKFISDNLGKSQISDEEGVPLAVKKALLAINKYCISKDYFTEVGYLQKFVMIGAWFLSEMHDGSEYLETEHLASHFSITNDRMKAYLDGRNLNIRNLDIIKNLEETVAILSETITGSQSELLQQVYDDFHSENAGIFPGVYGVRPAKYSDDWSDPNIVAKHIVELCLRQGGLMPAGKRGEGAENYDVENPKNRHHIIFNKASNYVIDLILLGKLHYRFTYSEVKGDLDYYSLMRYMRDSFEGAIPPSFWDTKLQDKYIGRLREFITEWESTESSIRYTDSRTGEKVDFIKIKYGGETYNLQGMIEQGWITQEWVDNIIKDIKSKLGSR